MIKPLHRILSVFGLFLSFLAAEAWAQHAEQRQGGSGSNGALSSPTIIELYEGSSGQEINEQISFLVDTDGVLGVDDLRPQDFTPHRNGVLNFGFTTDVIWVRLDVKTPPLGAEWVLVVEHPILDRVDLFMPRVDGGFTSVAAGDFLQKSERDLKSRPIAFELEFGNQDITTFFLRIDSGSSVLLPMTISERRQYISSFAYAEVVMGLFFGALVIMALYNTAMFVSLRDPNYLVYALAVLATALFQATLSGHFPFYIFPDTPQISNPVSLFSLVMVIVTGLGFSILFLESWKNLPVMHWLLVGVIGLGLFLPILYLFAGYSTAIRIGAILSVVSGIVALVAGLVALQKNVYAANFYVIARTGFCIGASVTAARQLGLLPDMLLTEHAMRIGSLLEVVLLAFALSDRYNLLRLAKEAAERQTADELRHLDNLKNEILANTSHELRTPLQGIIGVAESMLDGATGKLTDVARHNLALIVSSGRRLSRLVDDILDFSRLKNHELRLNSGPVDLYVSADVSLTLIAPLVNQDKVNLINSIPHDLPPVFADEARVQQVFGNLIGNAVKFTESGTIEVSAQQVGDLIEVAVKDSGIGIDPGNLTRIFETFEQGDGTAEREHGGTGLGLSITKQLVEIQGGDIRAESKLGEGSTFFFILPVSTQEKQEQEQGKRTADTLLPDERRAEAAILPPEQTAGEQQAGQARILVVDDEPVNQQVLANHLSLANFTAVQAMDGQEALDLIEAGPAFDLVLLDVMMPHMSGYEVCRIIRETYQPNQLPVIMVTAKSRDEDLVTGLTMGANDYLAKPVAKQVLLARIMTHLNLLRINSAYANFVPYEFLENLGKESILDVSLGDNVELELSILWSDIRSFSTLFEQFNPGEAFDFINEYFGRMAPVIRKYDGFINSFIGDAMLGLFVNSAQSAVDAAIASVDELRAYNEERDKRGEPPIAAGIAVHFGTVRMGVVGELKRRQNEVFSDAVNAASRLEGLTKVYGTRVMISSEVKNKLPADAYSLRRLDMTGVKGRENKMEIFEILDCALHRQEKEASREVFETGVSHMLSERWAEAVQCFDKVLAENAEDQAARYHHGRCVAKLQSSPHQD